MGILGPNIDKMIKNNDIEGLVELLNHKKPDIRAGALLALSADTSESTISKVKELQKDPDPNVRALATLKFGDTSEGSVIENLKLIITEGSRSEKIQAMRLVGNRNVKKNPEISVLIQIALIDKDPLVRESAIKAAGSSGDTHSVNLLIICLHDKLHQIRVEAILALGQINDEGSYKHIIGSLADSDENVKNTARLVLKKSGNKEVIDSINDAPFIDMVKKMALSETSRIETIHKIASQSIKRGLPLLIKACSDDFKAVRVEAAIAIGNLGDSGGLESLVKLLNDQFFDVRLEAVHAMEKLINSSNKAKYKEFIEKTAKDDSHKSVREAARLLLEKK